MVVLITGGARSGKSSFAEKYAAHLGASGVYVATSPVFDEELKARVCHHQLRREQAAFDWETIEEPYALAEVLQGLAKRIETAEQDTVVLVDCLILWLSNWLLRYEQDDPLEQVMEKVTELMEAVRAYPGKLLLVTNEVGDGVVPEYELGRIFRDLAGWMNQRVAAECDQVFLVTAGIPVELTSRAFRF